MRPFPSIPSVDLDFSLHLDGPPLALGLAEPVCGTAQCEANGGKPKRLEEKHKRAKIIGRESRQF